MKYRCYFCENLFPAIDAIDGYREGYRIGFLCPKCRGNLVESPETVYPEGAKYRVNATHILIAMIGFHYSLSFAGVLRHQMKWFSFTIVVLVGLAMLIYGMKKYPKNFALFIMPTKPGPGRHQSGNGA